MSEAESMSPDEPVVETGAETAQLLEQLRSVQRSLLWKLEGLSDAELRRPMTKTGTNLIGIVKHLTGLTYGYLCSAFGREREVLPWELDEELLHGLDMWATPDLVAFDGPHRSPGHHQACRTCRRGQGDARRQGRKPSGRCDGL